MILIYFHSPMDSVKILIAGAGPAGLSCAYHASIKGYKVHLFEKRSSLAWKPCGEAIPDEALKYVPVTSRSFILNRIVRCRFTSRWETVKILEGAASGYVIDKKAFLEELLGIVELEGCKVSLNTRAKPSDAISYDLVVDATGHERALALRMGIDYSGYKLIPACQLYCKGQGPAEDEIWVEIVPYGYIWVFPRGGIYNAGIGGFSNPTVLRRLLLSRLDEAGLKPLTKPRFSALSVGGVVKTLRSGKLIVIGEAAGMVMPSVGEGIRYALYSGKICLENYRQSWNVKYGSRFRRAKTLLKTLLSLPGHTRVLMMKYAPTFILKLFYQGALSDS